MRGLRSEEVNEASDVILVRFPDFLAVSQIAIWIIVIRANEIVENPPLLLMSVFPFGIQIGFQNSSSTGL
jgi:hypothetical protein